MWRPCWSKMMRFASLVYTTYILLIYEDTYCPFSFIATNPLLVPLACSLVVAVGALFTCIICVCAHRKRQELMEKYSIKQPPVITAIPADQSITTPTTITHQYYTPGIVYTTSPAGQQQMTLARVQN